VATVDLTTVGQVTQYAAGSSGGSFDNTADAAGIIAMLITGISVDVAYSVLRRRAINVSTQLTDVLDGTGSDRMLMKDWPITAVASLTVNGLSVQASPDGVSAGFVFDERRIILLPNTVIGSPLASSSYVALSRFPRIPQNVTIVYTAGYTANTVPAADTNYNGAPTDLGLAVTHLVFEAYKRRRWVGQDAKTIAQGQNIRTHDREWPEWVNRIMNTYRRQYYVG